MPANCTIGGVGLSNAALDKPEFSFPGLRMHDARHTHATLMLEQGVNWKIISERLGHGSVAMTLDLYAQASPGLQQAAAQGFDKVLDSVKKDSETGEMSRA